MYFIADFYCAEEKLIVKIDGKIHDLQKEYGQSRDEILESLGLRVLRIKNEEFVEMKKVLEQIGEFV